MDRGDGLNIPAIVVTGLISVLLLYVTVVFVTAWFRTEQESELYRKRVLQRSDALDGMVYDQLKSLSEYRWVDADNGVVAIPIERAMDLVVRESARARGARARGDARRMEVDE